MGNGTQETLSESSRVVVASSCFARLAPVYQRYTSSRWCVSAPTYVPADSMDGGAGRCDLHFRLARFFDFPINAPNRAAHSLSYGLPCGSGGVYSLLRTSNPGARALQNLPLARTGHCACGKPQNFALYQSLAESLLRWREEQQIPGLVGAVVGATSPKELEQLATFFAAEQFPLLIPGIGKQGGSFGEVCAALKQAGYPLELARINALSALLQNWDEAPEDWPKRICQKMAELCA